MRPEIKAKLRQMWADAERINFEVPDKMPDHCYIRCAGSEIVDIADRVGDKWKLACAGVEISNLAGLEWSPTTTADFNWKACV